MKKKVNMMGIKFRGVQRDAIYFMWPLSLVFAALLSGAGPQASFAQNNNFVLPPGAGPSGPAPSSPAPALPADNQGAGLPSGDFFTGEGETVAPQLQQQRSEAEIEAEIRQRAFDAAATGALPMRPDEIREFMERFDQVLQAMETPVFSPPEPEISVVDVAIDPGAVPPVIKVAAGHVTTVSILDITGAPWPIYSMTYAGNFSVVQPEAGSNLIRITPGEHFAQGNMVLQLVDLDTPVLFSMRTHRDSVHYRLDARVAEYGPGAEVPLIQPAGFTGMRAGSPIMNAVLDGVRPEGSTRLSVEGVDGRTSAYQMGDTLYVRTPMTLLSPGWRGSAASADGMKVYALERASVLLFSHHGKMVRARLQLEDEE